MNYFDKNFEPTLSNILLFWAKLHSYKWPNTEKYSSHLVTLLNYLSAFRVKSVSTTFLTAPLAKFAEELLAKAKSGNYNRQISWRKQKFRTTT